MEAVSGTTFLQTFLSKKILIIWKLDAKRKEEQKTNAVKRLIIAS